MAAIPVLACSTQPTNQALASECAATLCDYWLEKNEQRCSLAALLRAPPSPSQSGHDVGLVGGMNIAEPCTCTEPSTYYYFSILRAHAPLDSLMDPITRH